MLSSLIAFRFIYYLMPLMVALLISVKEATRPLPNRRLRVGERLPDRRRAAWRIVHAQSQLQVADGDRELTVGRARVGGVRAQELELGDVTGREAPPARTQLEDVSTTGRRSAVHAARDERLGVR